MFCDSRCFICEFELVNTDNVTALFDLVKGPEHETPNADFMCSFVMLVFLQGIKKNTK